MRVGSGSRHLRKGRRRTAGPQASGARPQCTQAGHGGDECASMLGGPGGLG